MTPQRYATIREAMKLSQGELARVLGVDIRTINRRESSGYKIPPEASATLGLLWELFQERGDRAIEIARRYSKART